MLYDSQTQTDTQSVVKYGGNYLEQLLTRMNAAITFLKSQLNERNGIIGKLSEGVDICTSPRSNNTAGISSSVNMKTASPNNIESNNISS